MKTLESKIISSNAFKTVIKSTLLDSIDQIIRNSKNQILLGKLNIYQAGSFINRKIYLEE
jgi:hypothetical protein